MPLIFGGIKNMAVVSVEKLSEAGNHHRLDAEFYQPQYFIDFSKGKWESIKRFLDVCQYGISQAMTEEPKGYPIFRMDDIKDCFLLDDEVMKYIEIPEQFFEQFKLEINDILFNRVNAEEFVGRTGIFKLKGDYVFASYLIRLRVKSNSEILPDYLNIFLNTKYGKKQIRRFSRRAVNQSNVNAEELKNFKICIIPLEIQKQISKLSDKSWNKIEYSKYLYTQAENLLLEGLGLKDFKPKYELSYTANLSQAFRVHRVDAEYFQPVYDEVINYLKTKFRLEKLTCLASKRDIKISPIIQQVYRYIEISDIRTDIGDITYTERSGGELPPNARIPISGGEILVSKVRPTRKAIAIVPDDFKNSTICSSAFTVFNVPSPMREHVFISLRSIIGLLQLEQPTTGTEYPTLRDEDVENILVPILPKGSQQKVALLVQQSHEARKKAKELLEEAKMKVGEAIENEIKK